MPARKLPPLTDLAASFAGAPLTLPGNGHLGLPRAMAAATYDKVGARYEWVA